MFIKLIVFLLIIQSLIVAATTEEQAKFTDTGNPYNHVQHTDASLPLHRVKRRGFGSFFGRLDSKTTPKTSDYSIGQDPGLRNGMYGYSGSDQFNGNSYYLNNNYRESNLYYLIVSIISFGVIVYCCHQCRSSRNLEEEYRNQYAMSLNDDSSLIANNTNGVANRQANASYPNQFKQLPSAPAEQQIVSSVPQLTPSYPNYSTSRPVDPQSNHSTSPNDNVPPYASYSNCYADNYAEKPPTYQEAIGVANSQVPNSK